MKCYAGDSDYEDNWNHYPKEPLPIKTGNILDFEAKLLNVSLVIGLSLVHSTQDLFREAGISRRVCPYGQDFFYFVNDGRQIVGMYARRWQIEILFRELSSDLGLSQHQVTGDISRTEKSFALGIMAYLFVLRARHHDICPGKPWSLMQLQHHFINDVITSEVKQREDRLQLRLTKTLGKAA